MQAGVLVINTKPLGINFLIRFIRFNRKKKKCARRRLTIRPHHCEFNTGDTAVKKKFSTAAQIVLPALCCLSPPPHSHKLQSNMLLAYQLLFKRYTPRLTNRAYVNPDTACTCSALLYDRRVGDSNGKQPPRTKDAFLSFTSRKYII